MIWAGSVSVKQRVIGNPVTLTPPASSSDVLKVGAKATTRMVAFQVLVGVWVEILTCGATGAHRANERYISAGRFGYHTSAVKGASVPAGTCRTGGYGGYG
ncbi:hypothetical protein MHEL_43080 [Mycolicibacterium helvum]|uniref:Uncharacterized protein n=1 Tax=Mycolicibacterium helvum TaxID=1534349 RepID=A0A7I7TCI4_9MYCO|nr:hypothetical protein MHEL_43080 [Mycolicibacterium helvum]